MLSGKGSQEGSQQIEARKNNQYSENGSSQRNYLEDEDPINCPLMFKAGLMFLLTMGILAFVITFVIQVVNSKELDMEDFNTCQYSMDIKRVSSNQTYEKIDSPNLRRISKYYAYEKMILGLSISGLVLAFGLTVFLTKQTYDFCRCFDDCFGISDEESEQQSEAQNGVYVQQYKNQLKKRIQSNISMPKDQMTSTNILFAKTKKQKREEQAQMKVNNSHIRKYLRPVQQVRQIDKDYNQNGGNSNDIDCQCNDLGSCMTCCSGCLWCRTCFQAHHFRFYTTKNQQYFYWILYLTKTLFFSSALAYLIRIHITLNQMWWCSLDNARSYNDSLYNVMVIGIIIVCMDALGYIYLFVEGTLHQIIEGTLHEPTKSQHSDDSESSDDENQNKDRNGQHSNKRAKNYRQSESDSEELKANQQKKNSNKKSSQQVLQSQQEIPTRLNLLSSLKKDKSKQKFQPQKQNPNFSKDTDSFFIQIKTLGNKFMNDIGSQNDNDQRQKPKKKQREKKIQKDIFEPQSQSQESYQSSNKKPEIFVPQNLDKMPKFQAKKTVMVREEESAQQDPFWKSELRNRKDGVDMFGKHMESQQAESDFRFKKSEQQQEKPSNKFGAFNRASQSSNRFSKEYIKSKEDEKESRVTQFQKLSKFSTKF